MIVTAVIGLSYMPNVLSSHGSGLSYPDCQATDTCSSHLQVKYNELVNAGLKFHFPARRKLSEIKGPLFSKQACSCTASALVCGVDALTVLEVSGAGWLFICL